MENEGAIGALTGGGLAVLRELDADNGYRDSITKRKLKNVKADVTELRKVVGRLGSLNLNNPLVLDFFNGFALLENRVINGTWTKPGRPAQMTVSEAQGMQFPPMETQLDDSGIATQVGDMVRMSSRFFLPEIEVVLGALQMPAAPTPAQLQQIFFWYTSFQSAASRTDMPAALTTAQLSAFAAQIAASPVSQAQISNLFTGMVSQAHQAMMIALAGAGPLSGVQTQAMVTYFQNLVNSILSASTSTSTGPFYGQLLDIVTADGALITNTTSETAFDRGLVIPANAVPVGRSVAIKLGFSIPSGNSTDTLNLKLRQGSASGQTLLTGTAIDVANAGDWAWIHAVLTRRANSGSSARAQVNGVVAISTNVTSSGQAEFNFDWTSAQTIVATATWSAASASDQVKQVTGTAVLE